MIIEKNNQIDELFFLYFEEKKIKCSQLKLKTCCAKLASGEHWSGEQLCRNVFFFINEKNSVVFPSSEAENKSQMCPRKCKNRAFISIK